MTSRFCSFRCSFSWIWAEGSLCAWSKWTQAPWYWTGPCLPDRTSALTLPKPHAVCLSSPHSAFSAVSVSSFQCRIPCFWAGRTAGTLQSWWEKGNDRISKGIAQGITDVHSRTCLSYDPKHTFKGDEYRNYHSFLWWNLGDTDSRPSQLQNFVEKVELIVSPGAFPCALAVYSLDSVLNVSIV